MCDQPSVHYSLYLLVQIFAKYDNVPLDLYGLIEAEIRKLYYCEKKKACIEDLNDHIDDTIVSYEEEKRWFGGGRQEVPYTYIMPMRRSLNNDKWVSQLQRIEDIIVDDKYYINGIKISPYHERDDNVDLRTEDPLAREAAVTRSRRRRRLGGSYGFDIDSKQGYVSLIDDDAYYYDKGYHYHEGYYYEYDYFDHNLLKKIIRRQMDLEECKIKKH